MIYFANKSSNNNNKNKKFYVLKNANFIFRIIFSFHHLKIKNNKTFELK